MLTVFGQIVRQVFTDDCKSAIEIAAPFLRQPASTVGERFFDACLDAAYNGAPLNGKHVVRPVGSLVIFRLFADDKLPVAKL